MCPSRKRIVALALCALTWGALPAVVAADDESTGGALPTPFTAEQIRGGFAAGQVVDVRTWSPAGEAFQRWHVLEATAEACTMESVAIDGDGRPAGEPTASTTSWTELRDHALFPADRATRERTRRETALGTFDGWLYSVERPDGSTTTFFFADAYPGAPVWMRTLADGEPVFLMEQIRREKATPAGDRDGSAPGR